MRENVLRFSADIFVVDIFIFRESLQGMYLARLENIVDRLENPIFRSRVIWRFICRSIVSLFRKEHRLEDSYNSGNIVGAIKYVLVPLWLIMLAIEEVEDVIKAKYHFKVSWSKKCS